MGEITGSLDGEDLRFTLVVSRFNPMVTDELWTGAVDALLEHGVERDRIETVRVPGAWELPGACARILARGGVDAVVALGCVIRGGTPHFDYVAGECSKGLGQVAMKRDLPVAFGVLTVDSIEQAIERAGTKAGNKGADAALSAMEMVSLLRRLDR